MMISTPSFPKLENLRELPIYQLNLIKKSLEKFFFSSGMNIALYDAINKRESQIFRKEVSDALKKQLLQVAQLDIVSQFEKQDESEIIKSSWVAFEDVFKGGRLAIFAFMIFAANEGGQAGLDKMVPDRKFELKHRALKQEIGQRVEFLVNSIDKTGIEWVATTINNGFKEGLNATQIVRLLRKKANEVATTRGELITETELMVAMNTIEAEVYKRNGIQMVVWKTTEDEKVCTEYCVPNEMAGKVSLGELFPSGATNPPAHIQCRCYLLPVLPETLQEPIWTGN